MIDYSERPSPGRASVAMRGVATVAGWYAAVILTIVVLILTLPDYNADGTCEGIGFGCSPTPHDGAILLAIFAIPLLLCVGLPAAGATLAIAVAARIRSGVAAGTLAAFAGFAAAIAVPTLAA